MLEAMSIYANDFYLNEKSLILNYCRTAFEEKTEPSHTNMWADDWELHSNTLPYLIYNSDRFRNDNGDMFLLLDKGDIVGVSGVNISEFDRNVTIAGVRTWLNSELRGQFIIGRHLLPLHLKWSKDHGIKTVALTFNEYNKRLLPYFRRSGFGIEKKRNPNSLFYNGQYVVEFPVIINHTKQWVIYHKIDETYEPNWDAIRADK